jgi:hypothetical protein
MAHLLAPGHSRGLVASNWGAAGLRMPWGTHPDHEPRYSSSVMSIEHHLPQTRLTKVRRLREAGLAEHLRVCLRPTGGMNCGVCGKCMYLRTALRLLGGAEAAAGVPFARNDREDIYVRHLGHLENWSELLALAEEQGEPALVKRMVKVCRAFETRKARRQRLHLPEFKVLAKRAKRRLRAWSGLLFRVAG